MPLTSDAGRPEHGAEIGERTLVRKVMTGSGRSPVTGTLRSDRLLAARRDVRLEVGSGQAYVTAEAHHGHPVLGDEVPHEPDRNVQELRRLLDGD